MNDTAIEWTEKSWNPVTGCTPVSEGCRNCYARRMAHRLRGRFGYPADEPFRVTLHPERLEEPLRLTKPSRIFVASMGDLFHDDVPMEFIAEVFNVMACATADCGKRHRHSEECWGGPPHTFLILTKRPRSMKQALEDLPEWVEDHWSGDAPLSLCLEAGLWPLHNVWLGVTVENQARADERIPILLQTPAAVRFVSCEPLLSAIDLSHWLTCACDEYWPGQGHHPECPTQKLHWCIVGGETGPNARPCHPDWVRSLRDQCQAAGVPFFFKSWGQYCYPEQMPEQTYRELDALHNFAGNPDYEKPWGVGKKAAGRLLDGRTWNEYPEGGCG